ncbi:hypothetical protein FEM48_Zijuj10G0137400 [Ziziphus jujuba var. spinosa]|uniref:Uncharacterized protein n=1 Tax=Ziziphus jujuba var. spinosa TaxID=714518 RepID=A0A978UNQ7_ZIZJJ|nr:hypothetical protein FEM48_Zijuj10G0137400 [Ziziphus jujuba var. spinosa]
MRRYQRLSGSNKIKRKLKVERLGDNETHSRRRCSWKIRALPKLRVLKLVSPAKLLAKFHDSYVDMMIGLAGNVATSKRVGFAGKRVVAKDQQISVVSCGEEVDSRLVLEIYKRFAASRSQVASC